MADIERSSGRMRHTWLLRKRELGTLFALFAIFTGVWYVVGWAVTHPFKDSAMMRRDEAVNRWFVPRRTPRMNTLTYIGSMMSDTMVKIIVTAIVAAALLIIFKRWLEPLMVIVPLAFEALTFITITALVGRPRPDVPRLEGSPIGSSYPSGHTAAAVVYSAIAVVIFWHTRRVWVRALAVFLAVAIPFCVAYSRVYRGMHHLSDVIAGALLGGAWVFSSYFVIRSAERRYLHRDVSSVEPETDAGWPAPDPAGWRPYPERDAVEVHGHPASKETLIR